MITSDNKVVRDGKVAVLYSPGWGAGWFTWNTSTPQCIFEPQIVELVEQKRHKEIEALSQRLWNTPDHHFYSGGADDLSIAWIEEGVRFDINEYDGNESIVIYNDDSGILS